MLSFSETTDACYRIQFDPVVEFQYFCYLAPGDEVLWAPEEESDDEINMEDGGEDEEDAPMDTEGDELPGNGAEEEENEDETEAESDFPSAKRQKVK